MNKVTEIIEICLEKSKYLVLIPVIILLLSAAFLFAYTIKTYAFLGKLSTIEESTIITKIISAIDLFLLGIVALMVAVSLYELYIKKLESKRKLPSALFVGSLDELKQKLGKVIYLILVITFFKYAINYSYDTIQEILLFAIAIFFISLSLYFSKKQEH